jgi:hypothetical protein
MPAAQKLLDKTHLNDYKSIEEANTIQPMPIQSGKFNTFREDS